MSYPVPVPEEFEAALTTCSDEELQALATLVWNHSAVDAETAHWVNSVVRYELTLRQQEPLWRKASRFYKRHHEEIDGVAKLAAVFVAAFGGAAAYDFLDSP